MEASSKMLSAIVDAVLSQAFPWGLSTLVWSIYCTLIADDTLVFCGANLEHLHYLRALFLCFEVVYGLKVNLFKLELVPVDNVDNVDGSGGILGCRVSSLPLKYLGLLLGVLQG
jgi:hypothetical protein